MARITWDDAGKRLYESGVERGVLFVDGAPGVPWNGLISINETPNGGEARPYYLDGQKYLNVAAAEEFVATIEAFSAPEEFSLCDGMAAVHRGLFATQQPRQKFGLVYRTGLGNDISGLEHGYKLHIVYNALAAPAQKSNVTLSNNANPTRLSWSVTTLPPTFSAYKPTAHLVIDSTKANKIVLGMLESALFGTPDTDSRLPTPEEIYNLFAWDDSDVDEVVKILGTLPDTSETLTNQCINPSFEYSQGSVIEVRRNLMRNAKFEDLLGWEVHGLADKSVTNGVLNLTGTRGVNGDLLWSPLSYWGGYSPGDRMSAGYQVENAGPNPVRLQIAMRMGNGSVMGPIVEIAPGETRRVLAENIEAIADVAYMQPRLSTDTAIEAGFHLRVSQPIAEKRSILGRYFDELRAPYVRRNGATSPTGKIGGWYSRIASLVSRVWEDDAGRESDRGSLKFVRNTSGVINATILELQAVGVLGSLNLYRTPVVPDDVWTASVWVKSDVEFQSNFTISVFNNSGSIVAVPSSARFSGQAGEWIRVHHTFTIPSNAVCFEIGNLQVRLPRGVTSGGEQVWTTDALFEKSEVLQDFFDGDSELDLGLASSWEVGPTASASYTYLIDLNTLAVDTAQPRMAKLQARIPRGLSTTSGAAKSYHSSEWASTGDWSVKVDPMGSNLASGTPNVASSGSFSVGNLTPNSTYTVLAKIRLAESQKGTLSTNALRQIMAQSPGMTPNNVRSNRAPNEEGVHELRLVFTLGNATNVTIFLENGSGITPVWFDDLAVVAGVYEGSYFDGNGISTPYRGQLPSTHWDVYPDNSTSYFEYYTELPLAGSPGDAYYVGGKLYVWTEGYWLAIDSPPSL